MVETHSLAPLLLALLPIAGVGLLFSSRERTGEESLGRYLSRLLFVALMLLAAWRMWRTEWPIVSVVLVFFSGCALGILLRGLFNTSRRFAPYGTITAIALILIGGWVTNAALEEDGRRYWAAREMRERLAAELAAAHEASAEEFARMRVKRDPDRFQSSGVREAQSGPLFGWLAMQPLIEVDWAYEEAQRDTRPAQRRIPLSIALLNDRFEPTALEPIELPGQFPDETQAALWLAWITARDGHEALVYFSGAMPPERLWLAPAERVDFTVNWNGRDRIGNLLPPGRYTAHLQSAQLAATHEPARLALDFEIRDSGPIITRIPDPVMQSLQAQERALQEQRRVNQGWQAVQQWQWKPLLPQPHR